MDTTEIIFQSGLVVGGSVLLTVILMVWVDFVVKRDWGILIALLPVLLLLWVTLALVMHVDL